MLPLAFKNYSFGRRRHPFIYTRRCSYLYSRFSATRAFIIHAPACDRILYRFSRFSATRAFIIHAPTCDRILYRFFASSCNQSVHYPCSHLRFCIIFCVFLQLERSLSMLPLASFCLVPHLFGFEVFSATRAFIIHAPTRVREVIIYVL